MWSLCWGGFMVCADVDSGLGGVEESGHDEDD